MARKVEVEFGYCKLGTREAAAGFITAGCRPKVPPMTLANWVRWGSGHSWCISWPPADSINSWLLPPPPEGSSKASCEEILICCCCEGHSTVVGWTMVPLRRRERKIINQSPSWVRALPEKTHFCQQWAEGECFQKRKQSSEFCFFFFFSNQENCNFLWTDV